jgi:glycosyltransferase involved in cell wall biosynthesis
MALADRGRRKGWHHALQAFLLAFGDDTNYRLILKMRTAEQAINITNPNVEMIQQDMTEEEMYQLFLSVDVVVNPNLGEGFGLFPREFAATGGLSLATNWGGTADDIEEWGLPIAYTLVPAWADYEKHKGLGLWAEPDIEELALLMDVVAESRDAWRPRALRRAARIRDMYSWEQFAKTAYDIWHTAAYSENAVKIMEMV